MEGRRVSASLVVLPIMLALAGVGEMHSEARREMGFSIGSVGVYGAAPPRILEINSFGLACATNLSHDLQQDITLRKFTGIGSKCIDATDEVLEMFHLLAKLVADEKPQAPNRGDHYLRYRLGNGSDQSAGVLALRQDETENIRQAAQIFHALHHQISVEGDVGAGIFPELHLREGGVVELLVRNIGNKGVLISSPVEWKDSVDPTVPRVSVSIWGGGRSSIAVLASDNWISPGKPDDPLVIPAGESMSLKFALSAEHLEGIELMQEAYIGGRLRLHVRFEDGPSGMATGNVEARQVKLQAW